MDVSQLYSNRQNWCPAASVYIYMYCTGVYCAVVCAHIDLGMYNVHVHCLHAGAQWMSRSY